MSAVLVAVLGAGGALLLLLCTLHHLLYRAPLPRTRGTATVSGLDGAVTVRRDSWGVPHISATTLADAAFALGFVHAQDRGWQLDLQRRVACGRVSEIAGVAGLEADRLLRRLGFARVALAEEAALAGEERTFLEAYAAGVNAVMLGGQPRPIELRLLRQRFEPWRPAHTLASLRLLELGLACDMDFELQRLRLAQAVGPDRAQELEPAYPDSNPTILPGTLGDPRRGAAAAAATSRAAAPAWTLSAPSGVSRSGAAPNGATPSDGPHDARTAALDAIPPEAVDTLRAGLADAARWLPSAGSPIASNSWVVDGRRTATGRPILCNDPHLPPSVPSVWYEAHVRVEGDVDVAGAGFVGIPFVVIGHTETIAWGFTNSFADVQDLVVEELVGDTRYRTEAGPAEAEVVEERIEVKGRPPVVERVVVTRHGPVVAEFAGADGVRRGLALMWGALERGEGAKGLLALARARDARDLREALWHLDAPQSCVWADVVGNVGYVCAGRIPVRPGPASRLPQPGWDADRRFVRWLAPEELPQDMNPPLGVFVTANNRVCGPLFPHHVAFDTMNGYRARRIERLVVGRPAVDAERLASVQLDVVCLPALEATELLGRFRCDDRGAESARRELCAWDGVMAPDRAEPLVYEAFTIELQRAVLEPLCGPAWTLAAGEMPHAVFGTAGNISGRMLPELLRRWREDDRGLLGGRDWEEVAEEALVAALARLAREVGPRRRWRWGRVHGVSLDHVMGIKPPLTWLLNLPRVPVGGNTDTVMQTAWTPGKPFTTRGWAPSWRQVLEVGAWDSCTGVHLPGQSGHPASRHHHDLVDRWLQNSQHPLPWSEAAVAAATEATLVLRPPAGAAARRPPSAVPDDEVAA